MLFHLPFFVWPDSLDARCALTISVIYRYTKTMMGGHIVAVFLSAVIFFLQGGDCLSMILKDKQSLDCCKKGHCSRTNPDPCCQISAKADIAKDQVKEKTPLPALSVMSVITVWVQPINDTVAVWASHRSTLAPSPPGERGNFSVPLLV